jgi:hypothetical protein
MIIVLGILQNEPECSFAKALKEHININYYYYYYYYYYYCS